MSGPSSWWLDVPHNDEIWAYLDNCFSPEECKKIIEIGTNPDLVSLGPGIVGGAGQSKVDESIRKSSIGWFPVSNETDWIFRRLTDVIKVLNEKFFEYDLSFIENLQFTVYKEDSNFYGKHIDAMYESNASRKLSISVQLTDPDDYKGGELKIYSGEIPSVLSKKLGTCVAFPSWSLHEVTPVTKGTRYALVTWVCGPRFK